MESLCMRSYRQSGITTIMKISPRAAPSMSSSGQWQWHWTFHLFHLLAVLTLPSLQTLTVEFGTYFKFTRIYIFLIYTASQSLTILYICEAKEWPSMGILTAKETYDGFFSASETFTWFFIVIPLLVSRCCLCDVHEVVFFRPHLPRLSSSPELPLQNLLTSIISSLTCELIKSANSRQFPCCLQLGLGALDQDRIS